jgi:hypothetical protein
VLVRTKVVCRVRALVDSPEAAWLGRNLRWRCRDNMAHPPRSQRDVSRPSNRRGARFQRHVRFQARRALSPWRALSTRRAFDARALLIGSPINVDR